MTDRKILWCSLLDNEEDAAFLNESVEELLALLRAEPLNLDIRGGPLDGEHSAALEQLKAGSLGGSVSAVLKASSTLTNACRIGLVVYCDPDAPLALAARRLLPHAVWGISLSGAVSVIYARANKYAIWHETLHLLGAQDHYDLTSYQRTCESSGCIMQYAPEERSTAAGPLLCEKTLSILRKVCGNHG